jgi:sugar fermentation stimulation protein A
MQPELPSLRPVSIPLDAPLEAKLLRRYKRFLADVELADGSTVTIHCPNPGSMLGTQRTGSAVRCSTHDNPKRKHRHSLEMIRVGRSWVGLHAARANDVAGKLLQTGSYSPFARYARVDREVAVAQGSRFDFRLSDSSDTSDASGTSDGIEPCWVEVKSVTLCEARAARFPDAVTDRGRRHLEHLVARRRAGERAALLYIVQRSDADSVAPADDIDPAYGETLRWAAAAGVELHALGARVLADRIRLDRILPVLL